MGIRTTLGTDETSRSPSTEKTPQTSTLTKSTDEASTPKRWFPFYVNGGLVVHVWKIVSVLVTINAQPVSGNLFRMLRFLSFPKFYIKLTEATFLNFA